MAENHIPAVFSALGWFNYGPDFLGCYFGAYSRGVRKRDKLDIDAMSSILSVTCDSQKALVKNLDAWYATFASNIINLNEQFNRTSSTKDGEEDR